MIALRFRITNLLQKQRPQKKDAKRLQKKGENKTKQTFKEITSDRFHRNGENEKTSATQNNTRDERKEESQTNITSMKWKTSING